MKTKRILESLLLVISINAFSQSDPNAFRFYKLNSISGEASIKGLYRHQDKDLNSIIENEKFTYLYGGASLKTNSYFLHPNFLLLDVDAGYYPETSREKYIVAPEQAEVRSLRKLDLRATLFNQKKVTLTSYANFDDSFQNRENLTDVKSTSNLWGGTLTLNNKYVPLTVDVHQKYWLQKETATTRKYSMDETVFMGRINKSFSSHDQNELIYNHSDYNAMNEYLFKTNNTVENISLNDFIYFDKNKKYAFSSMISNFTQKGNNEFDRFQTNENLTFRLPQNFTYAIGYNYNQMKQGENKLGQQAIQTSIEHKLFKSLDTKLFAEYNQLDHTSYKETNDKLGGSVRYTKQLPTGGLLSLYYMYNMYHQDMSSIPTSLFISNEEYALSDNQIVLLKRPNVELNTIVVKDYTGAIIYQKDLDYIIIDKKPYVEIRRVPGGLIPDNATVYIDYSAMQQGTYKYDADNQLFNASLMLFKRKLEIYYRLSKLDYRNLEQTDFVTLDYHTQNVVGGRLDFGFMNGGAEYEDYQSSIIPHIMTRYYVNFQKNYHEKLFFTLGGNMQTYNMINEDNTQRYIDVTTTMEYEVLKNTRLSWNMAYRNQSGRGIDLDLLSGRGEVTTNFRQLYFTLGAELYKRTYTGEKIYFKGGFFQIARKF